MNMHIVPSLKYVFIAALCFVQGRTLGQEEIPWIVLNPDSPVPTNTPIYAAPLPPPLPFVPAQSTSILPDRSFQALGDNNTATPPDTHGAVGPNHVMTMLNSSVRIQNRAGTTISTVRLSSWWSSVGPFTNVFDPRIVYDPGHGRWIATAACDAYSASAAVLIGVSQTTDPTDGWYRKRIKADADGLKWVDQPKVGFNRNWIVVSSDLAANSGEFFGSQLLVFNKTNVYAGGTNRFVFTEPVVTGGQMPAICFDTNSSAFYLAQTLYSSRSNGVTGVFEGALAISTISGTPTDPTYNPYQFIVTHSAWRNGSPLNYAPQLGLSVGIEAGDSRVQSAFCRNGSIWCAQTIHLPLAASARSAIQWWEIGVNGRVKQVGRIDDPSGVRFYAYPSIAVNRFGDALIGYSRFSSNQYASANYSFRALTDLDGFVGTDTVLKSGEGPYYKIFSVANRWGDYSATVVDPVNDTDLWTIQEYAENPVGSGTNNLNGRWGTWWGRISVPVPTNDDFANAHLISGSKGATNGSNLRATRQVGETNHVGNSDSEQPCACRA